MHNNIKKLLLTTSISLLLANDLFANGAVSANAVAGGASYKSGGNSSAASQSSMGAGGANSAASASQSGSHSVSGAAASAAQSGSGSASSQMSNCTDCEVSKNGFYAGFQAGVGRTNTKSSGGRNSVIAPGTIYPYSQTKHNNRFDGGAFLGARLMTADCYVVGLELAGSALSAKDSFNGILNTCRYRIKFKRQYSFTPSLVLGKVIAKKYHVYGKLGMAVTQFNVSTYLETDIMDEFASMAKQKKTKLGFAPAIGVEMDVNCHLAVRLEFCAEFYGKTSKTFNWPDGSGTQLYSKHRSNSQHAKIGVVVKM